MSRLRLAAIPAVLLAGLACGNAGENLGLSLPGNGSMSAQVYYDRDFSGGPSPADTAFAGLTVFLLVAGTQDTVATDTTDANGAVSFSGLQPAQYSIAVDSLQVLGDSMVTTLTPSRVALSSRGQPQFISARAGYPILTVAQARAGTAGRKVVVAATILAGRQSFSDTTAHVRDAGGGALRLTRTTVTTGGSLVPGDVVRALGLIGSRNGQPVLDSAVIALAFTGPQPSADTLASAEAATAAGGSRDADLVRVVQAAVTDTLTVGADFRATVDDGSGPLEMLIDVRLQLGPMPLAPGDSVDAVGVLVPVGGGAWQLKPRVGQDITVF